MSYPDILNPEVWTRVQQPQRHRKTVKDGAGGAGAATHKGHAGPAAGHWALLEPEPKCGKAAGLRAPAPGPAQPPQPHPGCPCPSPGTRLPRQQVGQGLPCAEDTARPAATSQQRSYPHSRGPSCHQPPPPGSPMLPGLESAACDQDPLLPHPLPTSPGPPGFSACWAAPLAWDSNFTWVPSPRGLPNPFTPDRTDCCCMLGGTSELGPRAPSHTPTPPSWAKLSHAAREQVPHGLGPSPWALCSH